MDDDHMKALRHLDSAPGGRIARAAGHREYGEDLFPVETVLLFCRPGRETRAVVKVDEARWTITGRWRRRSWASLVRVIGPGCKVDRVD